MSATLVGAVIRPGDHAKVDNIDDSDTPNGEVEEKIILAKAAKNADCEWADIQCTNAVLASVIHWLEGRKKGSITTALPEDTPETDHKSLRHDANRLHLVNKLLYCNTGTDTQSISVKQFFIPTSHQIEAIKGCHHDTGHQGLERTMALIKELYFWPSMSKDVCTQIVMCRRCTAWRKLAEKAPLQPIHTMMPLKLFHLNYFQIKNPNSKGKIEAKNMLIVTNHFMRYMMGFITQDQKAETTAKVLWECVFMTLGFPHKILTDQGASFESKVIVELCKLAGVQKLQTTPYHPQGNGQVERANQTVLNMLGKLEAEDKEEWVQHLPTVLYTYNATRSSITGYSPYFLMYR